MTGGNNLAPIPPVATVAELTSAVNDRLRRMAAAAPTAATAAVDAASAAAATAAQVPLTTQGDTLYYGTALARLPGNTTTTPKALMETGTGTLAGNPGWVESHDHLPLAGVYPGGYVPAVMLTGKTAALGTTNLQHASAVLPAGLYLVSMGMECTATGTGTVAVVLGWKSPSGNAHSLALASMALIRWARW